MRIKLVYEKSKTDLPCNEPTINRNCDCDSSNKLNVNRSTHTPGSVGDFDRNRSRDRRARRYKYPHKDKPSPYFYKQNMYREVAHTKFKKSFNDASSGKTYNSNLELMNHLQSPQSVVEFPTTPISSDICSQDPKIVITINLNANKSKNRCHNKKGNKNRNYNWNKANAQMI